MIIKRVVIILVFLFFATVTISSFTTRVGASADGPNISPPINPNWTLPYSGYLRDNANQLIDGVVDLNFQLFENPGNNLIWDEYHVDVLVTRGYFTVQLGLYNPIDPSFFFNNPELVITVVYDNQSIESGPIPIGAAPMAVLSKFALEADYATRAGTADSATTANFANTANHAISADTAKNADSVPWTGITGIPPDILTDDDTLKNLSCDSDQGIAFVNNQWTCKDYQDNDTLAGINCTDGQSLIYDNGLWLCSNTPNTKINNFIRVAKTGGDYTTITAALNAIQDAAENNPYLISIAPGIYEEKVEMKPHVHVQGSGQEVTIIQSSVFIDGQIIWGTVNLADNTSLRDLSVYNFGDTNYDHVAISTLSGANSAKIINVTVKVSLSSTLNMGIYVSNNTTLDIQNVTSTASGGDYSYGLYAESLAQGSPPQITVYKSSFSALGDIEAHGIYLIGGGTSLKTRLVNASANAIGVANGLSIFQSASADIFGGEFSAFGSSATGIQILDGTLVAKDSSTVGEGDGTSLSSAYGLVLDSGSASLSGSRFTAKNGDQYNIGIRNSAVIDAWEIIVDSVGWGPLAIAFSNSAPQAKASLNGGSFTVSDGLGNPSLGSGIENSGYLHAKGITIKGSYGLRNFAFVDISDSEISGNSHSVESFPFSELVGVNLKVNGIYSHSGEAKISNSYLESLIGGINLVLSQSRIHWAFTNSTDVICYFVSAGDQVSAGTTCPPDFP